MDKMDKQWKSCGRNIIHSYFQALIKSANTAENCESVVWPWI
jgi:hypothetical protein